ncbi:unnamed protein product [Prorocentrum cordatum]|uniref:RRM domain-containing protein n=1 Tax=Prorocentrum cordatum TaxID=2364126 RepID=A0ABN9R7C3_9DINO|nr:unnamed protein product [Polarella glacialis]|mmetsp:Transcript_129321/g.346803  ORF Transcript_129321/g.346803 Transcript_129321/m.346803 type:complete len:273 (-) Transcript_129321:106-924(-)
MSRRSGTRTTSHRRLSSTPARTTRASPRSAAWELWPVPAPKPKRHYARIPTAMFGQASALPSPGQRVRAILGTRLGNRHTVPVDQQTTAAPATAIGIVVASTAQETLAHAVHERKVGWQARRATQPRITTLVVRNLHTSTSQQEFLDEVNRSGFVQKYNFAYLPRNFGDGSGKGVAFINFRTADAASTFAAAWHRSRRLSTKDEAGKDVPLNVSSAFVQGLEANLRKWTGGRVTRVQNADFLPFVLEDAEPEPMASWPEASELAAVVAMNPR